MICDMPNWMHKESIFCLETVLFISRLKSPVTIMFLIPVSNASDIDVFMLSSTAAQELGGL